MAAAHPEPRPAGVPVHLVRTREHVEEIAALAAVLGEPAGLEGLLHDLRYRAGPARAPRLLGRAVDLAYAFDDHDQKDTRWWPQGVTTSADSSDEEVVAGGRRILVASWYAKPDDGRHRGARLTFLDLDTLRYRHVLLVVPTLVDGVLRLEPLRVHAGGVAWFGPYVHVAATGQGFVTARVEDVMAVPGDDEHPDDLGVLEGPRVASFGHHYVLPVRMRFRAETARGAERLRYSFLSLDRSADPPLLLAGEYGRGGRTTRFAQYPLDPATLLPATDEAGVSRPLGVHDAGVRQMQGAVRVGERYYATVSQGSVLPGTVCVGSPGRFRRFPLAVPMGPEDLSYWPSQDRLWSLTEHPHRRWIVSMRRDWFARRRFLDRQAWLWKVPAAIGGIAPRRPGQRRG